MRHIAFLALAVLVPACASAQAGPGAQQTAPPATTPPAAPATTQQPVAPSKPGQTVAAPAQGGTTAAAVDPTYVIGPDDVLTVLFWRDKETSTEVVVRPDGKITLPLINDVQAAGLTPDALRARVQEAALQYFQEPSVSVVVKQVNSRKVYVTGSVAKPGTYPLTSQTTVLQILAMAGGLTEYAKKDRIGVLRVQNGQSQRFVFNYKDVMEGKKLEQNIVLKPGDTVMVP